MTILEWVNTPSDLYQMAIEVGHAWDEGLKTARDAMRKADELKQQNTPKGKPR